MIKLFDLVLESIDDQIWYHGTNKSWEIPQNIVGEFDNQGGFFLTSNIDFAKRRGKIIKKYKLKPDTKIFNRDNEDHFLKYTEQVLKEHKRYKKILQSTLDLPNIGIGFYAILLDELSKVEDLEWVLRKAYPEIKGNVYNTVMDDMSGRYSIMQYLLRKKQLGRDYYSIETNDTTIKRAGFDGAFIWESGIKNIQLYNLDVLIPIE